MTGFDHVTALAVIGERVLRPHARRYERAIAAAALTSTVADHCVSFSLTTHVVGDPPSLRAWAERSLAHDPMLVGYRLQHLSRRLAAAGLGYSIAASFQPTARHDVAETDRSGIVPLEITALRTGLLAVGEQALAATPVASRTGAMLASLAAINAVASWLLFVAQTTRGPSNRSSITHVRRCLAHDLLAGGASSVLLAGIMPARQ